MLHLDGSFGEGGGQIVRTSLSLAVLSGRSVRLTNIRGGRPKPGLRPQHLTVVNALAGISRAEVQGASLDSRELTFRPQRVEGGHYCFDVAEKRGSAGAVSLIAQALLPPLLHAAGPSSLVLRGGTHVPWSPPAHYLLHVFLPALKELGVQADMALTRWGWYPRGGGEIRLSLQPCRLLEPVRWATPMSATRFQGLSAASGVPAHVSARQARRLRERLGESLPVAEAAADSRDPGSFVFLWAPRAGFGALGARGKPAEKVADEAADALLSYIEASAAADRHLADQLVLYLAQARGPSTVTVEAVTTHLLTNIWVIEQFWGPTFRVRGKAGEPGEIFCHGGRGP
ncbi:MAG: RNA 3'-phosphate cyclase [Deltaproteobacteria bacterium]|nr:RNA 3'-phosphate cyclase [Deltaproteobacteria bacterium]